MVLRLKSLSERMSLARSSMSVLIRFISNLMLTRLSGNPRFAASSWSVGSILGQIWATIKLATPRSGASEALADLAFAFQQIVIAIASARSITVADLRSVDRVLRSRSSERSRVSLKMRVQRNAVAQEEPLDSGQQQSPDRGEPKQIVYDADPYAHLTAGERYTLAIQRRDALLAARSRSSC
jgi:hypothetical protein